MWVRMTAVFVTEQTPQRAVTILVSMLLNMRPRFVMKNKDKETA